jgi:hypothetical protein
MKPEVQTEKKRPLLGYGTINISAALNNQATIEELLEASFFMPRKQKTPLPNVPLLSPRYLLPWKNLSCRTLATDVYSGSAILAFRLDVTVRLI